MPTLEEIIKEQRKRLLARESALVDDIERMMREAIQSLEAEAARAADLQQRRIGQGQNPLSAQITQARANTYIQQLRDIITDVAGDALTQVLAERRALTIASAGDFLDAANATDVSAGIDPQAIERIALSLNDGPVRRLFSNLPDLAAARARDALFTGVATGMNPRRTARAMTKAADIAPQRAATIARTETLRAYRNAMLDRMQKAPEIEKWVWISARDRRTCAFCWSQHGHVFSTERQMATHPNCRCSQGPLPKGANTTALVGNGKALFDKLKPVEQLAILGPAKFRAFKAGALSLQDLVGHANHVDWGPIGFERSLRGALGNDLAMKYYKGALSLVPTPKPAPRPRVKAPPPPPPDPLKNRTPVTRRPALPEMVTAANSKAWKVVDDRLPTSDPGRYKDLVSREIGGRMDKRAETNPTLKAQLAAFAKEYPDPYSAKYSTNGPKVASKLINTWAGTSADSSVHSLTVQKVAADRFDVPLGHLEKPITRPGMVDEIRLQEQKYGELYKAYIEEQYVNTQDFFKAQGISEVTLYRGQSLPGELPARGTATYRDAIALQPLSSFTTNFDTTNGFIGGAGATVKLAVTVPVAQLFGTAGTGVGCFNEYEFVVIGSANLPAHALLYDRSTTKMGSLETFKGSVSQVLK